MPSSELPYGNITDKFLSPVLTVDQNLNDFIIINKTAGILTVNIQISDGLTNTFNICPFNMQFEVGDLYGDQGYIIKAGHVFLITTNGSLDYYIDITPAS